MKTLLLLPISASAEESSFSVSVQERSEAANAYDQGTAAYLSGQYVLAAHWFERAHRLVPTAAALLQAVRAHHKAGNTIRAGNLALELRDGYPDDARAHRAADAIINRAMHDLLLVNAECTAQCDLELDGAVTRHTSFFTTPEAEHTIKAEFEHGETSISVSGEAGASEHVLLVAPSPPPPPPVPRWAFYSSLGATVALGAATFWSGMDANRGVDEYESAARTAASPGINGGSTPTPAEQAQSLLDEGRAKERRTNILIGFTAGMALTTAVLGVFTNWKGEPRDDSARRLRPEVGLAARGGTLSLQGRF